LERLIGRYIGLPVEVNIGLATDTLIFAVVTSLLAGSTPAWRTASLNTVEALRRE
jgi:ABC-type lipoprotein release transport system permease subunit